jgi:hypothetical protein
MYYNNIQEVRFFIKPIAFVGIAFEKMNILFPANINSYSSSLLIATGKKSRETGLIYSSTCFFVLSFCIGVK